MQPLPAQTEDPIELVADVASTDPVAPALLLTGVLLLAFSVGVVGFLAGGAVLEAIARPFE